MRHALQPKYGSHVLKLRLGRTVKIDTASKSARVSPSPLPPPHLTGSSALSPSCCRHWRCPPCGKSSPCSSSSSSRDDIHPASKHRRNMMRSASIGSVCLPQRCRHVSCGVISEQLSYQANLLQLLQQHTACSSDVTTTCGSSVCTISNNTGATDT
jgi:hypothetical protein